MVDNLGTDGPRYHFQVTLRERYSRETCCRLEEHCVDLVAGLGGHVVGDHRMLVGEADMRILLDSLHMVQVYFIAHQH